MPLHPLSYIPHPAGPFEAKYIRAHVRPLDDHAEMIRFAAWKEEWQKLDAKVRLLTGGST